MSFRPNPNLQAELQKMLAPKMKAYQQELNEVLQELAGKPMDEIHQALVDVTERHGIKPNVEQLRELVEQHAG
ncbi:hypothetical protein ACQP1K_17710 [Sphaerimonospora sp. CA-214678]|uniref:hypothetical protein n=1 Tax=Sphaerimonospora sp. CA-214678 TaxID=3240029 RepID=UPI003D8C5D5F